MTISQEQIETALQDLARKLNIRLSGTMLNVLETAAAQIAKHAEHKPVKNHASVG